jgi:hypothetical protein
VVALTDRKRDRCRSAAQQGLDDGSMGAELLGDYAHGYIYAQRTADDRIALGGRGIPYRYGSRIDDRGAPSSGRSTR